MNPWTWLDGKKTMIGTVALMASAVLSQVVAGIWGMDAPWLPRTVETLDWLGLALGGVGLAHKGLKTVASAAPKID